jgi:hypothetical protein
MQRSDILDHYVFGLFLEPARVAMEDRYSSNPWVK